MLFRSSILNETYLKQTIIQNEDLFKNVFVTDDTIIVEPYLMYYVKDETGDEHKFNLNRQYFAEEGVYFKDILKYYGLLEENKTEYYFTTQEINDLIVKYMEEQNNELKR